VSRVLFQKWIILHSLHRDSYVFFPRLFTLIRFLLLLLLSTHSFFILPTARSSISQPRAEFLIWKSLNLAYYCSARCCFLSLFPTQPPSHFSLKKTPVFKTKHKQKKLPIVFPEKLLVKNTFKKITRLEHFKL